MRAAVLVFLVVVACGSAASAPPSGSPLRAAQLKFEVINTAGQPVYCDPDYYPLVRAGGEQANAIARYPEIKADAGTYAAILAHERITDPSLTDAQKLAVYRDWKLLRALDVTAAGNGYTFQYRVRSGSGSAGYQMVAGTVRIDGVITILTRTPTGPPNCPICLAASTLIATPSGTVRVTEIRLGEIVWTESSAGVRMAAPVVAVGSMAVPAGHLMVHLVLADGRELLVSPGHRTAQGARAGDLNAGQTVDGSRIKLFELVPYAGERTYDLLPGGPTGHYWASGIDMSSTLS